MYPNWYRQDLHEGVRETDFGTVDSAIAGSFDECKVVGIVGVLQDALEIFLLHVRGTIISLAQSSRPTLIASMAGRRGHSTQGMAHAAQDLLRE